MGTGCARPDSNITAEGKTVGRRCGGGGCACRPSMAAVVTGWRSAGGRLVDGKRPKLLSPRSFSSDSSILPTLPCPAWQPVVPSAPSILRVQFRWDGVDRGSSRDSSQSQSLFSLMLCPSVPLACPRSQG